MTEPNPDTEITITYAEFRSACVDVGSEMTAIVRNKFGNGLGDQIKNLTAIYAAELSKKFFRNEVTDNV